jgi:hypothetical protein
VCHLDSAVVEAGAEEATISIGTILEETGYMLKYTEAPACKGV